MDVEAHPDARYPTMKTEHRIWLPVLSLLGMGLVACHKQTPVEELEKAAAAIEKMDAAPAAKSAETEGDFDPAKYVAPAKQLKEAISDYKAGKLEDAVTRLQVLRAQPILTPQQRMAVQDSVAAVMADIYVQAEKGDARAAAAVAKYEQMQSGHR